MKRFKVNNTVTRLQDYLKDPVDLYFLICKGSDEDVYRFNRNIGCHSYRDSDGIHKGMLYRDASTPLCIYRYSYRKSLKSKKRMYKKTLRSISIRRRCNY